MASTTLLITPGEPSVPLFVKIELKAKDSAETAETMARMQSEATTGTTNLGALLKAKLDTQTK